MTENRRLLLNGVGLHQGGGLVLLRELGRATADRLGPSVLDTRLDAADRALFAGAQIQFVPPRVWSRVKASCDLAGEARPSDTVFTFNSLPPVRRPAGRSIVYVHAPYLAGLSDAIAYPLKTNARMNFERLWFTACRQNVDEFWVQTHTTALGLADRLPGAKVRVLPFVATELRDRLISMDAARHDASASPHRYLYPADRERHKNQTTLLRAWAILGAEGLRPALELTLHRQEFLAACTECGLTSDELPNVTSLGRVQHAEILAKFAAGASLIFPSRSETLGLPLLEATAAGADILVSELDYARDVCTPTETFDPTSARSIADAVRRHLGVPRRPAIPFDAAYIVGELLE